MAIAVKMPKMSDTMTEGVVADWLVKVGDQIESGDIVGEVETDKATMEFENFEEGTILYLGAEKGGSIPINGLAYIVGEKGEDIQSIIDEFKAGSTTKTEEKETPKEDSKPVEEKPKVEEKPIPVAQKEENQNVSSNDGRIKASPLAKKIASEKGINLAQVNGSGPSGRVIKDDIENYRPSAASSFISAPVYGEESFEDFPVSQMRKVIAQRLGESKFSAPHFYLTMEINMDNAIAARKHINEISPVRVSFNDIVIKASAVALRQHPKVNSSWLGDKIRMSQHIHIGMAVAVEEGLLVPVIRHADGKQLSQIAAETKDFAQKAKDKKLQPQDWEGNTFTISNLGMMGIEEFTAIINPPDACILAVGAIIEKPIVQNGEIKIGNTMKVTLSCDHRVVDGMVGSQFLKTLKENLESPVRMLV